jgi:hypothetical protein
MQYLQRARECGFEATVTPELHHDNSQAWVISDTSALPP